MKKLIIKSRWVEEGVGVGPTSLSLLFVVRDIRYGILSKNTFFSTTSEMVLLDLSSQRSLRAS